LFFVFGMCTALDTYASQAYGQNDEGAQCCTGTWAVRLCAMVMIWWRCIAHCDGVLAVSCGFWGFCVAGAIAYWTVVSFVVMTIYFFPMAGILFFARDPIAFLFRQPEHISNAVICVYL